MADIRPFAGIHYRKDIDLSKVIAPPYDVLDERQKAELQARHPNNIVTVDLPFLPPKSVGPDEVYKQADITLKAWRSAGVLVQDRRPALYPYSQSYDHNGRTLHRRGFICLVKLQPFGETIVPHEKTFAGPIEDRLKLMRFTGLQLSPIFGLYSDSRGEVNKRLYQSVGKPELAAELDGVRNQLWSVTDADVEDQVIRFLGTKPIYIADGHHRYTTALHYQREMEQASGGPLPASHPANWVMFVLVPMQDDGLMIFPTHRLIGGIPGFHIDTFRDFLGPKWTIEETALAADHVDEFINNVLPLRPSNTFGLYDGIAKKLYQVTLNDADILATLEPDRSVAWRRLDVAILQRFLLDEVIQPKFNAGRELVKGYTANAWEVAPMVDGTKYQIALLLKSTPLGALEQLGRQGEVMPQKSTYFYPKVATGMLLNPLGQVAVRK